MVYENLIVNNGSINLPPGQNTLFGGGIFIESLDNSRSWSPLILKNTIVNNSALILGGGVAVYDFCSPQITGNTIRLNRAGCDGGGAYLAVLNSASTVSENIVSDNEAGDHGGGLYVSDKATQPTSTIEITRNIVSGNVAGANLETADTGAGIYLINTPGVPVGFSRKLDELSNLLFPGLPGELYQVVMH